MSQHDVQLWPDVTCCRPTTRKSSCKKGLVPCITTRQGRETSMQNLNILCMLSVTYSYYMIHAIVTTGHKAALNGLNALPAVADERDEKETPGFQDELPTAMTSGLGFRV